MTALEQAIAAVKREHEKRPYAECDVIGFNEAAVLNAVATGQLVPAQVWTTETNTLPWAFLTIGQMRAFEQSQGELERLGLNGEWIATDTPLSPGLVYRTKPAAPPAEGV